MAAIHSNTLSTVSTAAIKQVERTVFRVHRSRLTKFFFRNTDKNPSSSPSSIEAYSRGDSNIGLRLVPRCIKDILSMHRITHTER